MARFTIQSDMKPQGDQPQAIEKLIAGVFGKQEISNASWRNRQRQDLHDGQCHRQVRQAGAGDLA